MGGGGIVTCLDRPVSVCVLRRMVRWRDFCVPARATGAHRDLQLLADATGAVVLPRPVDMTRPDKVALVRAVRVLLGRPSFTVVACQAVDAQVRGSLARAGRLDSDACACLTAPVARGVRDRRYRRTR